MNPSRRAGPGYVERLSAYWRRMLGAQLATGWVAETDRRIVGSAMLLLHEHPGRPGNDPWYAATSPVCTSFPMHATMVSAAG